MGSANILLSYRRADASGMAGRIFDRLSQHYGPGRVFIDIDNIPMGVDFHDHLEAALADCGVLLALIGPKWIGRRSGKPARIHDVDDWVRVEVEKALGFGIPVIPVLLDGAALPKKELLPPSLHPMLRRNGVVIDAGKDFHAHVNRLIEGIDTLHGAPPRDAAQAATDRPTAWRWVAAVSVLVVAAIAVFTFLAQQNRTQVAASGTPIERVAAPVASTEVTSIEQTARADAAGLGTAVPSPFESPPHTSVQASPAQIGGSAPVTPRPTESPTETRARWFAAVSEGDVRKIAAMLDSGIVTIKTPVADSADTALHLAAERCDNEVVRFLLARGGDPLRKNAYNDSPLRIAQVRCPSPATTAEILGAATPR